jgi:hypothetical protein
MTNTNPQLVRQFWKFTLSATEIAAAIGANASGNISLQFPGPNPQAAGGSSAYTYGVLAGNVPFWLPPLSTILGYRIKGTTQFAWGGGGSGTLKAQLGVYNDAGSLVTIGAQSADLIAQAVTDQLPMTDGALYAFIQYPAIITNASVAAPNLGLGQPGNVGGSGPPYTNTQGIFVTFTSSVSNVSLISAGVVDVWLDVLTSFSSNDPFQSFNPNF